MWHQIVIAGNVGKDPEMRYTPSGQAVTSFSVATNRQFTNSNGEQIKETIWFRISAWGKLAEICNQYVKKGSKVLIEGRLTPDKNTGGPRIWTKQDGTAGASFEVTANMVRFLSSRQDGDHDAQGMDDTSQSDQQGDANNAPNHDANAVQQLDDIPF